MSDLKSIGYSDWFKSREDAEQITAHAVARIVSVHKDSYTVTKGGEEIFAELSGNLLYCVESAGDLPTTGDWVYVDLPVQTSSNTAENRQQLVDYLAYRRLLDRRRVEIACKWLICGPRTNRTTNATTASVQIERSILSRFGEVCSYKLYLIKLLDGMSFIGDNQV